jgi:fatty acid desaturase
MSLGQGRDRLHIKTLVPGPGGIDAMTSWYLGIRDEGACTMSATPAAAPRRIAARELLSAEQLVSLRQPREWRGVALIAHAWAVIFAAIALVAVFPNVFSYALAVMLIGSRQLGLAILMHEGAHRCLSRNETRNMALSQWLCAYPIFADTVIYRRYHLAHHAHTQQPNDPDLVLSAPFPITKASYRRKFWRDITGRTGYEQRKAQILNALGDPSWPIARRAGHFAEKLGPQIAVNALLLAGLSLAGQWWAYPLLWLVPLLTWMMVITRIRNIAEHAVVPDSDDPLRNTRTTTANVFERIFIAPYFVNYHLEHHLLYFVPCYNLPKLHAILMHGPHAPQMEVQRGYLRVLKLATARPDAEDRPGEIVNAARRMRAGRRTTEDQASSGF